MDIGIIEGAITFVFKHRKTQFDLYKKQKNKIMKLARYEEWMF